MGRKWNPGRPQVDIDISKFEKGKYKISFVRDIINKEHKTPVASSLFEKDMEFFKSITTKAHPGKVFNLKINPGLKNAVVMGRVTWESIPESFKPLKDRINIVVSSTLSHAPSCVQIVPNLNAAIDLLYNEEFSSIVDEVFIIGGHRLYEEALKQSIYPVRIYCTHILNEVDCDTYFPKLDWSKLKKVDLPDIPADTFTENGFTYKFCVYDVPSKQFI